MLAKKIDERMKFSIAIKNGVCQRNFLQKVK